MPKKIAIYFASILLTVFIATTTAQADPLTITSGFFGGTTVGVDRSWSLNISAGPNFSLRTNGDFFNTTGASGAFAVQPGEILTVRGGPGGGMPNRGTLFLDGVTYNEIVVGLSLQFTPVTFVVPELALGESVTITGIFSMTGSANITNAGNIPPYQGPPHFDFVGSGLVSFLLSRNILGIHLNQISYRFQEPEPVPEPATLILLSTGLAGAIGAARKRRSVKKES